MNNWKKDDKDMMPPPDNVSRENDVRMSSPRATLSPMVHGVESTVNYTSLMRGTIECLKTLLNDSEVALSGKIDALEEKENTAYEVLQKCKYELDEINTEALEKCDKFQSSVMALISQFDQK